MVKQDKIDVVAELKKRIQESQIVVLTKYVGLNAVLSTKLRKQLRDSRVDLKVYKNTLAKRALDELDLGDAVKFVDGPTAWAFSNNPVAPAKVLKEFAKEAAMVSMSGGILSGKTLSAQQLDALASLPPRDVLIGQVVGTIAAPLRNLVGVLSALPRNLVNVLDQVRKQKEGSAAA